MNNKKLEEIDALVASGVMSQEDAEATRASVMAEAAQQQQAMRPPTPQYQAPIPTPATAVPQPPVVMSTPQVYAANDNKKVWKTIVYIEMALILILAITITVLVCKRPWWW